MRLDQNKAQFAQVAKQAQSLAAERGVAIDDPGVVSTLAEQSGLSTEAIREALLAASADASEAAKEAHANFQGLMGNPDEPPSSTAILAVTTAQSIASSPAGVAGIVSLKAAHAIGSSTSDD